MITQKLIAQGPWLSYTTLIHMIAQSFEKLLIESRDEQQIQVLHENPVQREKTTSANLSYYFLIKLMV